MYKYRNGDPIWTTIPETLDISGYTEPKFQWAYDGNDSNVAIYGRLYTWYAVTDNRNVCPTGWHVPTDAEWCTLENFIDPYTDPFCDKEGFRGVYVGGRMKESGTSHWKSTNYGADNSSGFTALPGGTRTESMNFFNLVWGGVWWSTTHDFIDDALIRGIAYNEASVNRGWGAKWSGNSVRCVKD